MTGGEYAPQGELVAATRGTQTNRLDEGPILCCYSDTAYTTTASNIISIWRHIHLEQRRGAGRRASHGGWEQRMRPAGPASGR